MESGPSGPLFCCFRRQNAEVVLLFPQRDWKMSYPDFNAYYLINQPRFQSLERIVEGLTHNTLRQRGVDFLSVSSRTKTLDACLEKTRTKLYRSPHSDMTDIVGIRVIVYFEHQIDSASSVVRDLFDIDDANSYDQTKRLGHDRIGYRSNHFVCTLGESRKQLSEYRDIFDIRFEIQVRTILQHAWAELAHDRSYKLSAGLPSEIQREVNLYAGLLEIADKAFSRIANNIDVYVDSLDNSDILEEEINKYTLLRFIDSFSEDNGIHLRMLDDELPDTLILEMNDFGLKEIKDFISILTPELIEHCRQDGTQTPTGMVRDAMMSSDLDRYLTECWKDRWSGIDEGTVQWLAAKYPNAEEMLRRHSIHVLPNDAYLEE